MSGVHPTAVVASTATLGVDCEVGPYAVIGTESGEPVRIGDGTVIGSHASIGAGVTVGPGAEVLSNSSVAEDVPPLAIVQGVPAGIIGYRNRVTRRELPVVRASAFASGAQPDSVAPARLIALNAQRDMRGSLVVAEFGDLPFVPQRTFFVHGVASGKVRGEHAHRRCEQLLVAFSGSVRCIVDDGTRSCEVVLDTPEVALHLPAMTWGTQFGHTTTAALMVLASEPYDDADYIRRYETFLDEVASA